MDTIEVFSHQARIMLDEAEALRKLMFTDVVRNDPELFAAINRLTASVPAYLYKGTCDREASTRYGQGYMK